MILALHSVASSQGTPSPAQWLVTQQHVVDSHWINERTYSSDPDPHYSKRMAKSQPGFLQQLRTRSHSAHLNIHQLISSPTVRLGDPWGPSLGWPSTYNGHSHSCASMTMHTRTDVPLQGFNRDNVTRTANGAQMSATGSIPKPAPEA